MMTAKFKLSKRPVLRITEDLFFFLKTSLVLYFWFCICCISKYSCDNIGNWGTGAMSLDGIVFVALAKFLK